MLQNLTVAFDPEVLRARLVQQHGSVLGAVVFDATMNTRRLQDARAAELLAEFNAVQAQMSTLAEAAGEMRAKNAARLQVKYAEYIEVCSETTKADAADEARIAPLRVRSRDIQTELRTIAAPRLSERELSDLALYNSTNAERLRGFEVKLPPPATPPLDALGRTNMSRPLQ